MKDFFYLDIFTVFVPCLVFFFLSSHQIGLPPFAADTKQGLGTHLFTLIYIVIFHAILLQIFP